MGVIDLFLIPIYWGIFYLLATRTVAKNEGNLLYATYFKRGLTYKLGGALIFSLIYLYYYDGGDSVSFYYSIRPVVKLIWSNPVRYFEFLLTPGLNYPSECVMEANSHQALYIVKGTASLTTIRIGSILTAISLNSYPVACLTFAYISYKFQWKVFILMSNIYPELSKQFAIAFLMIPSVIFWGSGLGKDTIMLSAIMFFFYNFYLLVIYKHNILRRLIFLLITGYIISLIRGFILFTIAPCVLLMAVTYYRTAVRNSFIRFLVAPIMIIGGIGASVFFVRGLGEVVESYNLESLQQKAEGFRSWHQHLGETQGGSAYSLGDDFDYTPLGIVKKAPLALVYTLFGPFIWQTRNFVMLLSVMENLFFLYLLLKTVFNRRIYSLIGILLRDHIIAFCLPFIVILGIAIGVTSFNFGALVRYRIPILPFMFCLFIIIDYHLKRNATVVAPSEDREKLHEQSGFLPKTA